jgi:hypothetical protein
MAANTTAISIVSVSAGAIVALGGSILTARFATAQARRQHSRERQSSDLGELRSFLEHALTTFQEIVDSLLDLFSDIEVVSDANMRVRGRTADAHHTRIFETRLAAGRLRATLTALQLRVGRPHPLALEFLSLTLKVVATAHSIPDALPASAEECATFEQHIDELTRAQAAFIDLAVTHVGLDLPNGDP